MKFVRSRTRTPSRQARGEGPAAEAAARRALAATVLASVGELSAADLGGALGWRLKRSRETLEELVELGAATRRDSDGLALWSASPGNLA